MKSGEPCEACPVGAICTGSIDSPKPQPGFFARSDFAPNSTKKKAGFCSLTSPIYIALYDCHNCCSCAKNTLGVERFFGLSVSLCPKTSVHPVELKVLEGFPFESRDGKYCDKIKNQCYEKGHIAEKAFVSCVNSLGLML